MIQSKDISGTASAKDLKRLGPNESTWVIKPTTIRFFGTGLPYHSFGNPVAVNTPAPQNFDIIFPNRMGTNAPASTHQRVGEGLVGVWLNGVSMFSPSAARGAPANAPPVPYGYNYNAAAEAGRDLGYDFGEDRAGGHAAPPDQYHYHDFSFDRAWISGVGHSAGSLSSTGFAECRVIPYLRGGLRHPDGHSKILGFAADGYPVYGPYGYTSIGNNLSAVNRMQSGYTLKSAAYRSGTTGANLIDYPMGIFVQDYEFTNAGTLDTHNGRFCVTPDFPTGTYAYFVTIDAQGGPIYPYVLGNTYYGQPAAWVTAPPDQLTQTTQPPRIEWITTGGDLGTFSEQTEFDKTLEVNDPSGLPTRYTFLSGTPPTGISLSAEGRLYGYPLINDSNGDSTLARLYKFTVRASNSLGQLADRTFSISVNNLLPPQIYTPTAENLGSVFDSGFVNIQFTALDISPSSVAEWSVASGRLPMGLTLTKSGKLSGFALAPPEPGPAGTGGFNATLYDEYTWDFAGRSPTVTYQFTVRYYDGRAYANKLYSFTVISKRFFTVDNTFIYADNTIFTVDIDGNYYPSMLTQPDELLPVRQDRYFSFQFKAYYFNPAETVKYAVVASGPAKFDMDSPIVVQFDKKGFDQDNLSLPPGLTFDANTGWLTGQLPTVSTIDSEYKFQVVAYPSLFPDRTSTPITYTLTILNDIDNEIAWVTGANLGAVDNGRVSTIGVKAASLNNKELTYSLKSGRLPNGLILLPTGLIAGRASFQFFNFDIGTQIDVDRTTFDDTYTFVVSATTTDNSATADREFTIRLRNINQEPFENLYVRAFLPEYLRKLFYATLNDPRIISDDLLYRFEDPWFGRSSDLRFLAVPGVRASKLEEYAVSIRNFHKSRESKLSDLKYAVALDDNFNVKYEVLYVEVLDYQNPSVAGGAVTRVNKNVFPPTEDLEFIYVTADSQDDFESVGAGVSNFVDYGLVSSSLKSSDSVITIYPNSFANMTAEVEQNIGYEFQGALPEWMTSIQPSTGQALGFVRACVLAYAKPGAGAEMFFRVKQSLSTKGYSVVNLINQYKFTIDRYQLDNYLSKFYDIENRRFIPATNPSFNQINSIGLYNRGAWIVQDTNLNANINLTDIYNYSGVTVSVGTAGKIITSQDGTNWSLVDSTIDLSYETGLPFTATGNSTYLLLSDEPRLSAGSFLLNSNVASTSYYITKTVANSVSRATVISSVQKQIRLSSPLTSTLSSGAPIVFTSFAGANVTVTLSASASIGSNLILVSDSDQLDVGYGFNNPAAASGTFIRAKYANISLAGTGKVAGTVVNGSVLDANLNIGTILNFKDVITANAATGSSTLTFSSTEKIGTGSFMSGTNFYDGTYVLSKTPTTIQLSVPLKSTVTAEKYGANDLVFSLGNYNFNSVYYANGKWLIAGDRGLIVTSPDARTWDIQTTNQVLNLLHGEYGNGRWIVVGVEGIVLTSTDAEVWSPISLGLDVNLNQVAYGDGLWIIVGEAGTILTSTDGLSWVINNSVTTADLNAVTFGGGVWVAVGQRGIIIRSENGVNWNTITTTNKSSLNAVDYSIVFTAVGNKGTVLTSADAIDWIPVNSGSTETLNAVTTTRGLVTVGGNKGTIIAESEFFIVNFGVRNISFQDFNHTTVDRLRTLGYSVKDGDTCVWVQQEGYLDAVRDPTEPYENDGWNLINRFGDTTAGEDFDEFNFNQWVPIPGYQAHASDPAVPNKQAGIWQVSITDNVVSMTFLRQIEFNQTVYIQQDNNKYFYDPSIKLGKTLPEYTLSTFQQLDPVREVVTAPLNVDVYSAPQTEDKYIKFPN